MSHIEVEALFSELEQRHIRIWAEGQAVCLAGPKGTLSPKLKQIVRDHKEEVIRLLNQAFGGRQSPWPEKGQGFGRTMVSSGSSSLPHETKEPAVPIDPRHEDEVVNDILKTRPSLSDGLCLSGKCEHAKYRYVAKDGRQVPYLFCESARRSVYDMVACSEKRWWKDSNGWPVALQ